MPFVSVNEYLNRRSALFTMRVEVLKDDGVTWLNLSDRISHDRIMTLPGLTRRQTRTVGAAEVSFNSVQMLNDDRFWDAAPPTGIATWHRRPMRVSIVVPAGPLALATVLIDEIETSTDSDMAKVDLVGMSRRLIDKQADRVKNGRDWYTNRSIGWLVRQLLLQEFTVAEVASWPDVLTRYQIPLADPTARALSTYGRPPEYDGTTWRAEGTTLYGCPYAVVNDAASPYYGMHWMGIGGDLWRWDPATDVWTKWASMPAGRTNHKIFHVYINATRGKVVCVAWEPDCPPSTHPFVLGHRSGAKNGDVAVFGNSMAAPTAFLNEFAGQPLNIYTGHYFIRAGGTGGTTVNCGAPAPATADAFCYGVNIPVPFGHWTQAHYASIGGAGPYPTHAQHKTTQNGKADAADQGAGYNNDIAWVLDTPGYYAPYYVGAGGVLPLDYRWSMGQHRGAFALQNTGDDFVCTVISWDAGLAQYKFRIWKLNTNTGVWTDSTFYVMYDGGTGAAHHFQPTSLAFRSDDAKLLIAATRWKETSWSGGAPVTTGHCEPFGSMVVEYTYPLTAGGVAGQPTITTVMLNTSWAVGSFPNRFWHVALDAVYGATDYVLMSGVDVRYVLTGNPYVAYPRRLSTSEFGTPLTSNGRLSGAVYETLSGDWLVHDGSPNQVRSIAGNSVSTLLAWDFEDSGFPPVPGDPALLMGLVLDVKLGAVFGVSAPGAGGQGNAELMNNGPLSGKYYLWQLAGWLTDRVELADFSDDGRRGVQAMNVWAALEELAGMMDGVFDFDGDGKFYFKARPGATAPVATLAADSRDDTNRVPDCTIRKVRGSRNVFNLVEMTPSIAVLSPPKGAVRVLARPANFDRDPWNISPEVFQGNNRNMNLLLRCVKGGQPGSEDDGTVRKTLSPFGALTMVDYSPIAGQRVHKLRFAVLLYDSLVETQLTANVIAPDKIRIPLDAAKDVRAVESGIADVQARNETDEVTIADGEMYTVRSRTDLPASGECELRLNTTITTAWAAGTKLTIRTRGNNRWSDSADGVTTANVVWGSGTAGAIETITVFSTRNIAAGMVLSVDEDGYEEMRVLEVLSPTQLRVRRGVGGTGNITHVGLPRIKAYWAPIVSPDFPVGYRFEIGGTGVSLRFPELPDAGENPFMVGDAIEIVCPGLSLESQEKAKIIAYNVGSIQRLKGQKIPWPAGRQSRFAGYRQCVEITQRVARDYGDEHFGMTVEFPLRWVPAINETFLVEDPDTLPKPSAAASPNGDTPPLSPDTLTAVGALVESVTVDPLNDTVRAELRALNPHA